MMSYQFSYKNARVLNAYVNLQSKKTTTLIRCIGPRHITRYYLASPCLLSCIDIVHFNLFRWVMWIHAFVNKTENV